MNANIFNKLLQEGGIACDANQLEPSQIKERFAQIVNADVHPDDEVVNPRSKLFVTTPGRSSRIKFVQIEYQNMVKRLISRVVAVRKSKEVNAANLLLLDTSEIPIRVNNHIDVTHISSLNREELVPQHSNKFDYVSSMLSLHQMFLTEDMAKETIKNIAEVLKPNGRFFGVIINFDKMVGYRGTKIEDQYGAFIKFVKTLSFNLSEQYGQLVEINLFNSESVGNKTTTASSLIDMHNLYMLCHTYGLHLNYEMARQDFIDDFTDKPELKSILNFFTCFSFTKTSTPVSVIDYEYFTHLPAIQKVSQLSGIKVPSIDDVVEFYFNKAVDDLYNHNEYLKKNILKKDSSLLLNVTAPELNNAFYKLLQSIVLNREDKNYVLFLKNEFERVKHLLESQRGEIRRVIKRFVNAQYEYTNDELIFADKARLYVQNPNQNENLDKDFLKHKAGIKALMTDNSGILPTVKQVVDFYRKRSLNRIYAIYPDYLALKAKQISELTENEVVYLQTVNRVIKELNSTLEDEQTEIYRALQFFKRDDQKKKPLLRNVYKFSSKDTPTKKRISPKSSLLQNVPKLEKNRSSKRKMSKKVQPIPRPRKFMI